MNCGKIQRSPSHRCTHFVNVKLHSMWLMNRFINIRFASSWLITFPLKIVENIFTYWRGVQCTLYTVGYWWSISVIMYTNIDRYYYYYHYYWWSIREMFHRYIKFLILRKWEEKKKYMRWVLANILRLRDCRREFESIIHDFLFHSISSTYHIIHSVQCLAKELHVELCKHFGVRNICWDSFFPHFFSHLPSASSCKLFFFFLFRQKQIVRQIQCTPNMKLTNTSTRR